MTILTQLFGRIMPVKISSSLRRHFLMKDAKNDPIKKADLIRDMVVSISKIPDRIQREVYTQECARIMDISEQVLVSTLAQLIKKILQKLTKSKSRNKNLLKFIEIKPQKILDIQEEIRKIPDLGHQRIIRVNLGTQQVSRQRKLIS